MAQVWGTAMEILILLIIPGFSGSSLSIYNPLTDLISNLLWAGYMHIKLFVVASVVDLLMLMYFCDL